MFLVEGPLSIPQMGGTPKTNTFWVIFFYLILNVKSSMLLQLPHMGIFFPPQNKAYSCDWEGECLGAVFLHGKFIPQVVLDVKVTKLIEIVGEYTGAGMFGLQFALMINKLELHNKHATL